MDASRNIRLSSRAEKLLALYCDQASGFRPSYKFIAERTGIAINKVREIRQELVKKGAIQYDSAEGFIFIDWMRLKIFAVMEKPLTKHDSMKGTFAPVSYRARPEKRRKKIRDIIAQMKPTSLQQFSERPMPRLMSTEESSFFEQLEDMTEEKYASMVIAFPEYDRKQQRRMIPLEQNRGA